jgi:hypothetical protein
LLLLTSAVALGDKTPTKSVHALPVETTRSEAVEAARLRRWADALVAIDKAIAGEPTWAELYMLRAGIHVGNAGPESDEASMRRLRMAVNYDEIATELTAATDDWTKYLELQPAAKERKTLVKAIGEYRALVKIAKAHAVSKAQRAAQAAAYASGKPATCHDGRVLVDELHCCWPGQKWNGSSCTGQCPSGFRQDSAGWNRCIPSIVRVSRGASPTCGDGRSLYEYGPALWDEDVEYTVQAYENVGRIGLLELTKYRVQADQCGFITGGGGGLACCP